MTVYLIGTGVDGARTLTREAADVVAESELLIGASRMLEPFADCGKPMVCEYAPERIAEVLKSAPSDIAAVLLSGDIGFFSGAKRLLPLLDGMEVRCIPGISSIAYFCAKLGISYERMQFVSLHGRSAAIALPVKTHERCGFLLGGEISAAQVCKRLCAFGLGGVTVHIGENLGGKTEQIVSGAAADLTGYAGQKLAVLITENADFLRHLPSCIPDSAFQRGAVPMTKSVVRGTSVSLLKIENDSVCWDIGCGTGSVSIEMAYRCPNGKVFAFDKNPAAVQLTQENAMQFGCDNITVTEGICPDCLADAAVPDKVFIGGSAGRLQEVFACIFSKNPHADIAVTAVSLETLHEAQMCFASYGAACEIMQIAVTQTNRIGTHTMLSAQNPVFLIWGRLS